MNRIANALQYISIPVFLIGVWTSQLAGQSKIEQVAGHPLSLPNNQLAIFVESEGGVKLARLFNQSGATSDSINILENDVVISVNGKETTSLADFRDAIAGVETAAPLKMQIRRGEAEHEIEFAKQGGAFQVPQSALPNEGKGGWESRPATPNKKKANYNLEEVTQRIDGILDASVSEGQPGLTLAIWSKGKTIISKAQGLADLNAEKAMKSDTLLPIDSIAKQFTGCAIAMLATEGKLSLDDDIRTYVPELSGLKQAITLRNLLTHTSGLRDYTGLISLAGAEPGASVNQAELLKLLKRQKNLQFEPGTQHRYSNTNFALLPLVIERVTGLAFEDWMKANVFDPLSMDSTSFPNSPPQGAASLYSTHQDKPVRVVAQLDVNGDGGMISNSLDMMKWAQEIIRGKQISATAKKLLIQPMTLEDGSQTTYGLGIGVSSFRGLRRFAHSGSSPGSQSVLHIYPDQDFAICVLANSGDAQVSDIARDVTELFLGHAMAEPRSRANSSGTPGAIMLTEQDFSGAETANEKPISSTELDQLAGTYILEDELQLVFELKENRLLIVLAAGVKGVPLVHLGKRRFRFTPGNWEISFEQSEGPAQRITLHITEDSISRRGPGDVAGYRAVTKKLTEKELLQFTGQYHSSELDVDYRVICRDNMLYLKHPRVGEIPLKQHSHDRFGGEKTIREIQFVRIDRSNPASQIVGLNATSEIWSADAKFEKVRAND